MLTYLIKNQHDQYLSKDLEWVYHDGSPLFHTPHKDVALNQLIEINAKDILIRATVIDTEVDSKGRPVVPEQVATEESAA